MVTENSPPTDGHHALAEVSASRYLDYLARLSAKAPVFTTAIQRLCESYENPRDPKLMVGHIERLTCDEKMALLNPFALGLGEPSAGIVSVGTEAAYDLCDIESLLMEGYLLTAQWLATQQGPYKWDVAQLTNRPDWKDLRPFHRHPTDYYPHVASLGGHTWKKLAGLLCRLGGANANTTLKNLGERVYQIELSHQPSRRVASGTATSAERRPFLGEVFRVLGRTARLVLVHGYEADPGTLKTIIGGFLGEPDVDATEERVGKRKLWFRRWTVGDKQVLHTCALTHTAGDEYWEAVARSTALGEPSS